MNSFDKFLKPRVNQDGYIFWKNAVLAGKEIDAAWNTRDTKEVEELRSSLESILPLARAYALGHGFKDNIKDVEQAQKALSVKEGGE